MKRVALLMERPHTQGLQQVLVHLVDQVADPDTSVLLKNSHCTFFLEGLD